jgi:hypothetical protein
MDTATRGKFLENYRTIRHAEERGSNDPAYYLALPCQDVRGKNADQWKIRGRSYRYFERKIFRNLEKRVARPLDILDLRAGNCWMSHRLSLRNHRPVAVDIFTDPLDGLQAARDALSSCEYLDEPLLAALARDLGIAWRDYRVWYGWKWRLRPWKASIRGKRPPSQFLILKGEFARK